MIAEALRPFLGREVVLDTSSPFVYAGTLESVEHEALVLVEADVHDLRDTSTTRELYVLDTRRHGIHANRRRVVVRLGEVVSVSALEDVLD